MTSKIQRKVKQKQFHNTLQSLRRLSPLSLLNKRLLSPEVRWRRHGMATGRKCLEANPRHLDEIDLMATVVLQSRVTGSPSKHRQVDTCRLIDLGSLHCTAHFLFLDKENGCRDHHMVPPTLVQREGGWKLPPLPPNLKKNKKIKKKKKTSKNQIIISAESDAEAEEELFAWLRLSRAKCRALS